MTTDAQLTLYREALDSSLREFVERFLPGPDDFDIMLRYHLGWVDEAGKPAQAYAGKRLRPLLLLLSADAAGGQWQPALPAAIAVELLHNFSLVHDDIEDNSPYRRGRPTLWTLWGAANAINAGDALFGLAHMAVWQLPAAGIDTGIVVPIAQAFEHMCLQLTRGQYLDMRFEQDKNVSVDDYINMITGKSAALISTAMYIGAILSGLTEEQAAAYGTFGKHLGLAFQIQDDILGIWGDPAVTGKSVATDIQSKKKTLPILFGLQHDPTLAALYASELDDVAVSLVVSRLEAIGALDHARTLSADHFQVLHQISRSMVTHNPEGLDRLLALAFSLLGRSV